MKLPGNHANRPPSNHRPAARREFVSGFVAIVGRPNVGKSTFLNEVLQRKVAIVTPHPQTTRTHLLGILNVPASGARPGGQIVFVDTPGVHRSPTRFNREMMRHVHEALEGRDLALLMVDVTRPFGQEDAFALDLLRRASLPAGESSSGPPVFLLLNKIDRLADKRQLLPLIEEYRQRYDFAEIIPLSALKRDGIELTIGRILDVLPPGPEYFAADEVTDQPREFLIGEIVREKAMLAVRQEIPHRLTVKVEAIEPRGNVLHISAAIYCEHASQRQILLGRGGEKIRHIGTESRLELEKLLEQRIFLELIVLVRPAWRENPRFLADLDFRRAQ
jgi:GTP-binding protein Era